MYNFPSYQHCNFCIYFWDVIYDYINQIIYIYIYVQGRRQEFGSGEGLRTIFQKWIPLKAYTAMASPKFRFGEGKNIEQKRTNKFWQIYKHLHKELSNSSKFSIKFTKFVQSLRNFFQITIINIIWNRVYFKSYKLLQALINYSKFVNNYFLFIFETV